MFIRMLSLLAWGGGSLLQYCIRMHRLRTEYLLGTAVLQLQFDVNDPLNNHQRGRIMTPGC
jgi:hypothetical protein